MPFFAYESLPASSRVWVYQPNRLLTGEEAAKIDALARNFVAEWTSHNRNLAAWAGVLSSNFLVFMVDEQVADASGCSIDKSVAFVRNLEANMGLDFFDRWCFAYQNAAGDLHLAQRDDFAAAAAAGKINAETLVFNNLVKTKAELETVWRIPLGQSWHKNFI